MKYIPMNRHLLLEDAKEPSKEGSQVLVPDDYRVIKNFGTYRVVESALDCDNYFDGGELVVAVENMVQEVELPGDKKYYVIPENLVVLRSGVGEEI